MKSVRAEMLQIALPLHAQMYPGHGEHAELSAHDRENLIIGEVLQKISDQHPRRDQLQQTIEADLAGHHAIHTREEDRLAQLARQSESDTHAALRARHLFRGGIPQRAAAGAAGRSRILGHADRSENAGSQGRIEAARIQRFHFAVAQHSRSPSRTLRSVRTSQQHSAGAAAPAAFALCQRSVRRRLGRIHRAGDDGRRFPEQRSALPHGDAQNSPARDFQRDSGHQNAHNGHDATNRPWI